MNRWATCLTFVLLVVLAACSGPSTRDATRVVVPTAPSAPPPTATRPAPSLPTATPPPTAQATGTATSVPEATPTPRPSPTPSPTPPPGAIESALLAMLPSADILPAGWSLVTSGPVRGPSGGALLCGVEPFPGTREKLAEVEAEYQRDDPMSPASVIENVVSFPDPVAVEAMTWARETIVCREWTDGDGTTIELGTFADAGIGDESLETSFTVVSDGARVPGRWFFVRKGGLIATIAYLGGDADLDVAGSVVETAVRLLDPDRVTTAAIDPAVQSTLLGMLLSGSDIGDGWMKTASGPTQEAILAGLCGVWPYAGAGERLGDVTARFVLDAPGSMLEQRLVALPAAQAQIAVDAAREGMACGAWTDADGVTHVLEPPRPVGVGDDGAMTTFTAEGPDGLQHGSVYVVRVGAIVATVVFRSPEPLENAITLPIVERVVDLIRSGD